MPVPNAVPGQPPGERARHEPTQRPGMRRLVPVNALLTGAHQPGFPASPRHGLARGGFMFGPELSGSCVATELVCARSGMQRR